MSDTAPDTKVQKDGAAADRAAISTQNWKLLRQFNLYRLVVATAFVVVSLIPGKLPPFGDTSPLGFLLLAAVYATIGLAAFFTLRVQKPDFETHATALAFGDIALITLLMHTSGGLSSGLGLLMLVAVAECSVLLGRRMTIFYASLGTVAALLEHSWGPLTGSVAGIPSGYPQVGLLGIGLFITATLGNTLASRLRSTAALAERQSVDLANLANINDLIIQRMQSGVVVCDDEGRVRVMNRAAKTFLGVTAESGGRQPLEELVPDLDAQLKEWAANPAQRRRKILRTRSGHALLPRFILLGNPKRQHGNLIFLEDTEALKQQAQQLKMAALARLTASIAHEIRNPLSAVTNAAQLLKESTNQKDETERLLGIIENHSQRMNVIVENITQLSRRDRTEPIRMEIQSWLKEFVHQFTQTIDTPAEALAVYCEPSDLEVCADPDQLFQVVSNLCQNALRHSPEYDDKLLIKLQASVNEQDRPVLEVVDWGPGVSADIVDNIFDPFFTTTPKGTGLGLYIARELCEGNGGRLDYVSADSGGSCFRITFTRTEDCAEFVTS